MATAPTIVSTLNGFASLSRYGLASCAAGFGERGCGSWATQRDRPDLVRSQYAVGYLNFTPAAIVGTPGAWEALADTYAVGYADGGPGANWLWWKEAKARCFALSTCEALTCKSFKCTLRASRTQLASSTSGETTHIKPIVPTPPDAGSVIDELSLLLTAGRTSDNTAAVARARFERVYAATGGDAAEAAREAQQVLLAAPEFSISNEHVTPVDAPTRAAPPPRSGNRPFKGIVVLFLHGGADTWNLLVPHSECERHIGKDLYAEYSSTRTNLALKASELLPIDVRNGTQPCNTFGVHHKMKELARLYSLGDAAFVANVGQMVESIDNKDEFRSGRKRHPPSMFAHNFAQRSAQNVHAQMGGNAKGVLGRLLDHVTSESGGAYSPGDRSAP